MQHIRAIEHRPPYSTSSERFSNYDDSVICAEFIVEAKIFGTQNIVEVFFPRPSHPGQGVGLSLPSPQVAKAIARALLTVAEGDASEISGRFSE